MFEVGPQSWDAGSSSGFMGNGLKGGGGVPGFMGKRLEGGGRGGGIIIICAPNVI